MAENGKVKKFGKGSEVNGEGAEKVDGTSTTTGDLTATTIQDDHPKVAGLSNGKRMATIKANLVQSQ